MKYFKIFGERNTGTNVLTKMIADNSGSVLWPCKGWRLTQRLYIPTKALAGVSPLVGIAPTKTSQFMRDIAYGFFPKANGWKHAYVGDFSNDDVKSLCINNSPREWVFVIFTVRHPVSWLYALWRRPYEFYDDPAAFKDFLDYRIKTVGRENLGCKSLTPLELYEMKIRGYLDLQRKIENMNGASVIVRFEDIVQCQETVFRSLDKHLRNPSSTFVPIESSTKDKAKDMAFYKKYYQNNEWIAEMDHKDYQRALGKVDWEFYAQFSYAPHEGWNVS